MADKEVMRFAMTSGDADCGSMPTLSMSLGKYVPDGLDADGRLHCTDGAALVGVCRRRRVAGIEQSSDPRCTEDDAQTRRAAQKRCWLLRAYHLVLQPVAPSLADVG